MDFTFDAFAYLGKFVYIDQKGLGWTFALATWFVACFVFGCFSTSNWV